ncbi:MAG: hypothetical protein IKT78_01465 [Ruminiclostridium sp.]|nr:hypothetical protein [Ruminiclostridium sp.]
MKHEEIIELLTKQNERLLTILGKFAEKDINIVVNSYNGAYGESNVENTPTTLNGNNTTVGNNSGMVACGDDNDNGIVAENQGTATIGGEVGTINNNRV